MNGEREIITAWIAREIVPHEGAMRKWLARRWRGAVDAEDVIQEAYCRLAGLAQDEHIPPQRGQLAQKKSHVQDLVEQFASMMRWWHYNPSGRARPSSFDVEDLEAELRRRLAVSSSDIPEED